MKDDQYYLYDAPEGKHFFRFFGKDARDGNGGGGDVGFCDFSVEVKGLFKSFDTHSTFNVEKIGST